jgi:hypothetical protein
MNQTPVDPLPRPPIFVPGSDEPALGEDPADREAIIGPTGLVEAVLRHPRRVVYQLRHGGPGRLIVPLLALAVAFVAVYGLIVGSFSGGMQWWAAPAKIAAGMVFTAAICLPSLYIFACLAGSPAHLHEVAGALGGLLALMTLLLIGFAPVAWLFSQSTESVAMMGFLHLVFWLVATRFGVRFLLSAFRHFGLRSEAGLKVWVAIFVLVSLQMTTALRPLVGTAETLLPKDKKFFVTHWFDCVGDRQPEIRR